jgi:tetratricopeptide (TPR) repeat protein
MRRYLPAFALAILASSSLIVVAQTADPPKADAALIYRQARDIELSGRSADATALYNKAISICEKEIVAEPKRMDAWAVKCWSLFRLGKHQEVIDAGVEALKNGADSRIVEQMGESYFYLGNSDKALASFQRYLNSGQYIDRLATAYFFMGETYLRMRRWAHADIAYSTAVNREPSLPRWWFRLGQTCEQLGEWQRAVDAYNKALSLKSDMKEASEGLAA